MRAATLSPATRRSASICSPTVQHTPGMVRLMRVPELLARQARGMNEKADRRARARMRMQHAFGDRQDRLLAGERLADDAGKETRRRLVRLAGPHADRRQPDADAVEEAASRIIGEQQFADRLLRAVGGERREMKFVGDRIAETARRTPRSTT